MKFTVPDEILKKTTKCSYDFSCLTTGKCGNLIMCKVDRRFDKNMLYIKASKDTNGVSCPYKYTCGTKQGYICTCPTHYAIYKQECAKV